MFLVLFLWLFFPHCLFVCLLFCPILVCLYFTLSEFLLIILDTCSYSNEKGRKGVALGGWESGEELGGAGVGETKVRMYETIIFNNIDWRKKC